MLFNFAASCNPFRRRRVILRWTFEIQQLCQNLRVSFVGKHLNTLKKLQPYGQTKLADGGSGRWFFQALMDASVSMHNCPPSTSNKTAPSLPYNLCLLGSVTSYWAPSLHGPSEHWKPPPPPLPPRESDGFGLLANQIPIPWSRMLTTLRSGLQQRPNNKTVGVWVKMCVIFRLISFSDVCESTLLSAVLIWFVKQGTPGKQQLGELAYVPEQHDSRPHWLDKLRL